jgi:hypothetical protein
MRATRPGRLGWFPFPCSTGDYRKKKLHLQEKGRELFAAFPSFILLVSNDLQLCSHVSGAGKPRHEQVGRAFDLAAFPFPASAFSKDGGPGGDVAGTRARSWTHGTGSFKVQRLG